MAKLRIKWVVGDKAFSNIEKALGQAFVDSLAMGGKFVSINAVNKKDGIIEVTYAIKAEHRY